MLQIMLKDACGAPRWNLCKQREPVDTSIADLIVNAQIAIGADRTCSWLVMYQRLFGERIAMECIKRCVGLYIFVTATGYTDCVYGNNRCS